MASSQEVLEYLRGMDAARTEKLEALGAGVAGLRVEIRAVKEQVMKINGTVAETVRRVNGLETAQALDNKRHAGNDERTKTIRQQVWDVVKFVIGPVLAILISRWLG